MVTNTEKERNLVGGEDVAGWVIEEVQEKLPPCLLISKLGETAAPKQREF